MGDGGALMALGELETAARLGLRLLIVVYDDAAYGAEVHHFGPHGHPLDAVRFPDTDLAALARAAGGAGVTVRAVEDLARRRALAGRAVARAAAARRQGRSRGLRRLARRGLPRRLISTRTRPRSPMPDPVAAVLDALASGAVRVVDLTQPLSETTPVLHLPEPFVNTPGLSRRELSRYDDRGPAWAWDVLEIGEHVGTHFDAPIHWITGRDGEDVGSVPARRLVGPAVVIDRSAQAAEDPDDLLTVADVEAFEAEHGRLPDGAWLLLRTGWDARAHDQAEFLNAGSGQPQTPGPDAACARWLARGAADRRLRRRDRRHGRGRGRRLRPALPRPPLPARRGQVRPHPAREPRRAAARRRADRRGAAAPGGRHRQSHAGARARPGRLTGGPPRSGQAPAKPGAAPCGSRSRTPTDDPDRPPKRTRMPANRQAAATEGGARHRLVRQGPLRRVPCRARRSPGMRACAMRTARDPIAAGEEALAAGRWEEAKARFEAALAGRESGRALDGLGLAGWWLADEALTLDARERAYRAYRSEDEPAAAGLVAAWLAADFREFRGEPAIGRGWLGRAHRLLDPLPESAHHGWLAAIDADFALNVEGDVAEVARLAETVGRIGRDHRVADLEAMGLALGGTALVLSGRVAEGMRRLDEASAIAAGEPLEHPLTHAWTLCCVISACDGVGDFPRAAQWCAVMRDFSDRWGGRQILGICRSVYGRVLATQGDWPAAETELTAAVADLEAARPGMSGGGLARLAELRARQGRTEDARALLVRAGPSGQLGLAELALDEGDAEAAADTAERVLRRTDERSVLEREPALELLARALARLGRLDAAHAAGAEVERIATQLGTPYLRGRAHLVAAELALAAGEHDAARRAGEDAVDCFTAGVGPLRRGRRAAGPRPGARGARARQASRRRGARGARGVRRARRRTGRRARRGAAGGRDRPGGARRPDPARGRGAAAGGSRAERRGDRRAARPEPPHRAPPRGQRAGQAAALLAVRRGRLRGARRPAVGAPGRIRPFLQMAGNREGGAAVRP